MEVAAGAVVVATEAVAEVVGVVELVVGAELGGVGRAEHGGGWG